MGQAYRESPHHDLTGGCACGAVRYRLASQPCDAGSCHCRLCRRPTGAPVLAFATVPLTDFRVTHGEAARRRSSRIGEGWFCRDCGTELAIHADYQPGAIDVPLATLDDPELVRPGFHSGAESRVPWFDVPETRPRAARFHVVT